MRRDATEQWTLTCDDLEAVLGAVEFDGVRNEVDVILLFDARMTRVNQMNFVFAIVERRTDVVAIDRRCGERDQTVELRENSTYDETQDHIRRCRSHRKRFTYSAS